MDNNQINNNVEPVGQMNNNGFNNATPANKPKINVGIVAGAVGFVVVFIIVLFVINKGSKPVEGDWTCKGNSGEATIKLTKSDVEMTAKYGSVEVTMSGKLEKLSQKVTSSKKKDGYTYTQYKVKDAVAKTASKTSNMGSSYGFVLGISKDGKTLHYLDGSGSSSIEYECTKK